MNNLKNLRESKNLTLNELSDKIGIPYQTLRNYEIGKRTPKKDNAEKLANYYGVSTSYILGLTSSKTDLNSDIKKEFLKLMGNSQAHDNRINFIHDFSNLFESILSDDSLSHEQKQDIFNSLYRYNLALKQVSNDKEKLNAFNTISKIVTMLIIDGDSLSLEDFIKAQRVVDDQLLSFYLEK